MKILCVDDEPLALKMLEMSVKKAKPDAEVSAFRKPRELLEAAQQGGCDIAFLDIHMRGMNGVELAKELKTVNPPIVPKKNAKLRVQCFGNFDVFTPDGAHVRFERSKAKEVFAYLVHKQGSSCTTRELFAAIFEDEPYDKKLQNLLQTYIYAMIKSLKAVGAEDAVVRSYNALAVNPEVLDCDYYRFKELDAGAVNAYQNEYMSQYYWADFLYNDY